MSVIDFVVIFFTFLFDLSVAWSPLLLIAVLVVGGVQVRKMARLAKSNAATRARRREAQVRNAGQKTLAA